VQALPYRKDIDALRGVSVLLVVIYHAFPGLAPGGFVGVDIFFVISGYLITSIIIASFQNNNFTLKEFYSRRIKRLFPALFIVLLVSMVIGWLILYPDEYKQLAYHVKYSAIYFLNFKLIDEIGYFDVESIYKPVLHLWTLSVEEQYYVLWPLLLLIIFKQQLVKPIQVIILVAIASFLANVYYINIHPEDVYLHTATRVWQLAAGSILGIYLINKNLSENRVFFYIGVMLILISALFINERLAYPGWYALLPTLGALCFIYANVSLKQWGGMVEIGLISYPLYLWHWVVISFLYIYLGTTPGALELLFAVILSFVLAFLTYRYIERLRYIKRPIVPVVLFISVISVGIAGTYVEKSDGLPDRSHLDYLEKYAVEFARTPLIDDQCDSYAENLLGGKRLFNYCRSSNLDAQKYIAIIGDSHAHAIFPVIADEANRYKYGTLLLANSSCPPYKGFIWGKNDHEREGCKKRIKQILSILESDSRIQKVFITTRGPVYIHGEVEGEFTRERVEKSLEAVSKHEKLSYESFYQGFAATLEIISDIDSVKNVYYLLENPELDFLPKDTVRRPFDRWGITVQKSKMEVDLYLLRMSKYRDVVKRVAEEYKLLEYIDPMPLLCDLEYCISFKSGNFLYADDDHYSLFGSKYIAENISKGIF
jgi:peptidoglycan/LPS O-acetylase OafA/YrhL